MRHLRSRTVTTALVSASLLAIGGLTAPPAAAASCPGGDSITIIAVRGSGEKSTDHNGFGATMADLTQRAVAGINGPAVGIPVSTHSIDYLAVAVGYGGWNHYPANYNNSVMDGENTLYSYIMGIANAPCGLARWRSVALGPKLLLFGYSQGAHVVGDVFNALPQEVVDYMVSGVVLIGDPRFKGSQSAVNVGTYDRGDNGIATPLLGGRKWRDTSLVHSYCIANDPICNVSASNLLLCKKFPSSCPHIHYVDNLLAGNLTWTAVAASWAVVMVESGLCGPVAPRLIRPDGC